MNDRNFRGIKIFLAVCIFIQTVFIFAQAEESGENSRLILLAEDSFIRGLELEKERRGSGREDFLKSAAIYQTLIEERGIQNGMLFYNQGNSYFSAGESGRAILAYHRALRFTPMDRRLKNNLHQAEESITNRITPGSTEEIAHVIFFFHYDIPGRVKSAGVLIFAISFWTLMILGLYFKRSRRIAIIPLIFILFLGTSLLVEIIGEKLHPELILIKEETTARKGDATSYAPTFDTPLGGGTAGRKIKDAGNWWLIRLESGDECWIPESAAELVGL